MLYLGEITLKLVRKPPLECDPVSSVLVSLLGRCRVVLASPSLSQRNSTHNDTARLEARGNMC